MIQTIYRFRKSTTWILLPALLMLFACQDDPAPSSDGEQPAPERIRVGNNVSFEVRDFDEKPVPVVVVFEELDASGGAVYRFEHGQAQVMFQPGGTYTLQAEGFEDIKFKLEQIEDIRRFTFFMHKTGSPDSRPSIDGQIRRRNFRPYPDANVNSSLGEVPPLGVEGDFRVSASEDFDPEEEVTLSVSWVNDEQESRALNMTFPDLHKRIRLDIYLETDTPAEIRN